MTFHLIGPQTWSEVPAVLTYEPSEPFAVGIVFGGSADDADDDGVQWLLSRDLLRAGLSRPAGEGDVRLWPARTGSDAVFLQLRAPSGEALFEVSRPEVFDFLAQTERLVARGREADLLQVDEELQALLQGDGTDPGGR
jgi:hypothetical protein